FGRYDGRLGLRLNDGGKTSPLTINLADGPLSQRLKQASPKKELLARACGVTKKVAPRLLDASGGLARDALVLATCGARVTLIERNPFLFQMLHEMAKEAASLLGLEIEVKEGDAKGLGLDELSGFDTIYFDPMFPERSKSAAVKLEMQVLQALHGGPDEDAEASLAHLLKAKAHRTVIKRPVKAPELEGLPRPNLRMRNATLRFDVWLDF
ncbi:MAG: class I SAM-dependent methyltransferase, partial [Planctomycetes bacterium]|nr:class I SAM-dependent methyltransferase [Planctomycetota bacterium]